jgi:hypothetical protein
MYSVSLYDNLKTEYVHLYYELHSYENTVFCLYTDAKNV